MNKFILPIALLVTSTSAFAGQGVLEYRCGTSAKVLATMESVHVKAGEMTVANEKVQMYMMWGHFTALATPVGLDQLSEPGTWCQLENPGHRIAIQCKNDHHPRAIVQMARFAHYRKTNEGSLFIGFAGNAPQLQPLERSIKQSDGTCWLLPVQ